MVIQQQSSKSAQVSVESQESSPTSTEIPLKRDVAIAAVVKNGCTAFTLGTFHLAGRCAGSQSSGIAKV